MALFIDDGYTLKKLIPADGSLHDGCEVIYRPALAKKRVEYGAVAGEGNPNKTAQFEDATIAEHVVTIAGQKLTVERAGKLIPSLRGKVLNLVLGYSAPDGEAMKDAGN